MLFWGYGLSWGWPKASLSLKAILHNPLHFEMFKSQHNANQYKINHTFCALSFYVKHAFWLQYIFSDTVSGNTVTSFDYPLLFQNSQDHIL